MANIPIMPTRPFSGPDPATAQTSVTSPDNLAPEDAYMEGPYLVFTASYHLKRGFCCNSGCRHCPYH
jgi:hypothetical protein